jgi:hypothetical protein
LPSGLLPEGRTSRRLDGRDGIYGRRSKKFYFFEIFPLPFQETGIILSQHSLMASANEVLAFFSFKNLFSFSLFEGRGKLFPKRYDRISRMTAF